MSGCCSALGEWFGGANGLDHRFRLCRDHELRIVLVLGQDRPAHVSRAGGRAGHPLYRIVERLRAAGIAADAEGLHHSRSVTQRVCDRPEPIARGCRGHRGHPADAERTRARRRDRSRACARQAPRHPDQLRRGDDCGGDHDGRPHGAFRGAVRRLWRPRRRSRPAATIRSRCWR